MKQPPDDDTSVSSFWQKVANFFAATWIFIVGGLIAFYNADISPRLRTFIVVAVAVVIVAGVLAAGAWAFRSRPGVRKATATGLLVGLVVLTALAPVILLAESDRILLLKLGAIAFLALFPADPGLLQRLKLGFVGEPALRESVHVRRRRIAARFKTE